VAGRTITHRSISADDMAQLQQGSGIPATYAAMLPRDVEATRNGLSARVTDVVASVSSRPPTPFATCAVRAASAWARS
jgi:hypothetical protein